MPAAAAVARKGERGVRNVDADKARAGIAPDECERLCTDTAASLQHLRAIDEGGAAVQQVFQQVGLQAEPGGLGGGIATQVSSHELSPSQAGTGAGWAVRVFS